MGKFMLLLLVWDIVALFAIILRPNFKYSSDVISWLIAGIAVVCNNNQLVIRWIIAIMRYGKILSSKQFRSC